MVSSDIYETGSTSKQVELEVPSPPMMAETPAPEPIEEEPGVVEEAPPEEERSIARDRPRRVIRPPQRYADFVAYALSVGEETNSIGEPASYSEIVSLLIPPSGCFLCKKKLSLFIKTKLGSLSSC